MGSSPLHPSIVHLPLGLGLALPLLAAPLAWAVWTKRPSRWAWAVVVGALLVVLAGRLVAMNTGEAEEEHVERVVPKQHIHEHEEAAEAFVWTDGGVLVLALLGLLLRDERHRKAAIAVAAVGTMVVAGLGWRAGHEGGELVYHHGAAAAHAHPAGSSGPAAADHDA